MSTTDHAPAAGGGTRPGELPPARPGSIAIPAQIEPDALKRTRQVGALNSDFPHRVTFASDGGLIWSARVGPWAEPMTLTTDNPVQMRELLEREAAA